MFRKLVREGTVVESRAFRIVGDRLDTSLTQANTMWKHARAHGDHDGASSYADTATALVREALPASLPKAFRRKWPRAREARRQAHAQGCRTRRPAKRAQAHGEGRRETRLTKCIVSKAGRSRPAATNASR